MISKVKYVNYILLGLAALFAILFFFGHNIGFNKFDERVLNSGLVYMYVLGILALVLILGFFGYNYVINPKSIKPTLIVLITAAVIIGIGLIFSSSEILVMPSYKGTQNTPEIVKLAGINFITVYVLFIVAFVGIIVTEVINAFK